MPIATGLAVFVVLTSIVVIVLRKMLGSDSIGVPFIPRGTWLPALLAIGVGILAIVMASDTPELIKLAVLSVVGIAIWLTLGLAD